MKTECNLSFKRATLRSSERNSEDKLRQRFEWVERWTSTDMDYLSNCVFVDENGFDINMRPQLVRRQLWKPNRPKQLPIQYWGLSAQWGYWTLSLE